MSGIRVLSRSGSRAEIGSEKLDNTEQRSISSPSRRNWKSACVTFFASIISFVLGLVVLLSGATNGQLRDNSMVQFNMSTLGQGAIKFYPANSTNSADAGSVGSIIGLRDGLAEEVVAMPNFVEIRGVEVTEVEVREVVPDAVRKPVFVREALPAPIPAPEPEPALFPSPSDVTSFFGSIGSSIATKTLPGIPGSTATGTSVSGIGDNILSGLEGILSGIAGNVTNLVGDEIEDLVDKLVETVIDAAGIHQWYALYLTEYCSGDWLPSYSDPNAKLNITSCKKYIDSSIINTPDKVVNSTFKLGNTIVDVAPLNIVNKLSSSSGALKGILTAFLVFNIMGIVSCGLLFLSIPIYLLLSFLQNKLISLALLSLAFFAATSFLLTAIIVTAICLIAAGAGNDLFGDLGLQASKSSSCLAILWVSAVFMSISASSWAISLFRRTFVRRSSMGLGEFDSNVKEEKRAVRDERPNLEMRRLTGELTPVTPGASFDLHGESTRRGRMTRENVI